MPSALARIRLFRIFGAVSWGTARHRGARGRIGKDASAEKSKAGASIHLTVDGLQPIDLTFYLSGAPLGIYGGGNGGDIFLQAIGEPNDGTELAVFGSGDPLLDLAGLVGRQCVTEAECEVAQVTDFGALRLKAIKQLLLFFGHLIGGSGDKDGCVFGSDSLGRLGRRGVARFSPARYETRHHGTLAGIAFGLNFPKQSRSIVATFMPALLQVVGEFVHFCWATTGALALGKLSSPEPATDRLAFETHGATDGGLRLTGVEPGDDLLIPLQPPLPPLL